MNRRVLRNFADCARAGGRDTAAKKVTRESVVS